MLGLQLEVATGLLGDRPLPSGADDMLGFEAMAEGLAAQLGATPDGGLLVAVRAVAPGAGRTSFLNLLHVACLGRGIPVTRLTGAASVRQAAVHSEARPGLPVPMLLVDDARPGEVVAALMGAPLALAAVTTWLADDEDGGEARAPLIIDVPEWTASAAAALASRFTQDAAERDAWRRVLAVARTPRDARRIANAALAAASSGRGRPAVLTALACLLGASEASSNVDRELVRDVARFCGALPLKPAPAPPDAADGEGRLHGTGHASQEAAAAPLHVDDRDDEIEHRRQLCFDLGQAGGATAVAELVRLLADEHPAVRLSASHVLASLPDPSAAPAVRPLLASPDPGVRRAAAFVVGRLGDEASRSALVQLLDDASPDTRRAAAAGLARLGGAAALRPLVLAAEDAHAGVRMAVETALLRLSEDLPPACFDALLRDEDAACRLAAARVARRLAVGTRHSLEVLLASADDEVATHAALALGSRGDVAALPALAAAATSDAEAVREAAISAIDRLQDAHSVEDLAALAVGADADRREHAAAQLAGRAGAFEALLPHLHDEQPDVRRRAAAALGRCGDRRALLPLMEAHDGGDADTRRAAAASLVRLGFGR